MEAVIVIVGFLGAGKTTLLSRLSAEYKESGWDPFIILNDYENAHLDSQRFIDKLGTSRVKGLHGSCICCSGINELRTMVNDIPARENGITFIEANGTTDSVSLLEFLSVGLHDRFLPPVQISVVDASHWQNRGYHNELEANQIQTSSLIILNRTQELDKHRLAQIKSEILSVNPTAKIETWEDLNSALLPQLKTSKNNVQKIEHSKSHWSSCSVDLPDPMSSQHLKTVIDQLPKSILRVKGCTKLDEDEVYSYFEKTPTMADAIVRPYRGTLVSGPKLLVVGPGSDPQMLEALVNENR